MQIVFMVLGILMASSTSLGMNLPQRCKIIRVGEIHKQRRYAAWGKSTTECSFLYTIKNLEGLTEVKKFRVNDECYAEEWSRGVKQELEYYMEEGVPILVPVRDTEAPTLLPLKDLNIAQIGPEKE